MGARRERGQTDCRVLLVTADEGRRIRVEHLLARAGYRVQLAVSQREALHRLAHADNAWWQGPDVILVDQESLGDGARVVIGAVRNAELGVPMVGMRQLSERNRARARVSLWCGLSDVA